MEINKKATAIVFASDVEEAAIAQIDEILDNEFLASEKIRIMPDCHAGNNICIGFTSTMNGWAVPNYIGVDIGCGVSAYPIGIRDIDFRKFDKCLRENVPSGMNLHKRFNEDKIKDVYKETIGGSFHSFIEEIKEITAKYKLPFRDEFYIQKSIGTLGGGNHFIEINKNSNGELFLTVHSGSRNFGLKIANCFQNKVGEKGYIDGETYENYIYCMNIAQKYAKLNRAAMLSELLRFWNIPLNSEKIIESVHNYIDLGNNIIRKGAISAQKNEICIIPINMADGILLCKGKGNEEWNCSAPHGAGRILGRRRSQKELSMEEYEKRMKENNVWSSCINPNYALEEKVRLKILNSNA
jgi:RNA-splicing ligase RtcB